MIAAIGGPPRLVAMMLYGSELRLMEALSLRVHDLDFAREVVTVRGGKGNRDRVTVLSRSSMELLRVHLRVVKRLHGLDLRAGHGCVELPGALDLKIPSAPRAWEWQWVFPAGRL